MGKATIEIASDGLGARVAPPWTEEKLRILKCYVDGFAKACQRARAWYGLDLFAGHGLNISQTTREEIDGSARILLGAGPPPAAKVLLCEQGQDVLRALRNRTIGHEDRVEIFDGDANSLVSTMLARVPTAAPAFAFLDPEGSELAWETVETIARHKSAKKVEQLILFPTDMGFVRLLSHKDLRSEYAQRISQMFGHDEWRTIYESRGLGEITAEEAREMYLQLYAKGLRGLGYNHIQERQIFKESVTPGRHGQSLYFLVFATDAPPGEKIMNHCFNKKHLRPNEELGQLKLDVPTPVKPRQQRISDDG